jgi:iron-sulfur cluster assembly protein
VDFPVTVSPEALSRLLAWYERKGEPGSFVRMGVKGGGCSGLEYVLRLDTEPTPFDVETVVDGLRLVSDTKSAKFLQGATLVWTGNLAGAFQFDNPNAERQCGCGTSFTPKRA